MKKNLILLFSVMLVLTMAPGCAKEAPKISQQPSPGMISGTVVETIKAAGYTYVQIDTGSKKIWAATSDFQAKIGNKVAISDNHAMTDFHSKTLNRDFDLVYFVGPIKATGKNQDLGNEGSESFKHPPSSDTGSGSAIKVSGVKKAEGGMTVADIFTDKENLAGKSVMVRGKIIKFTAGVMGKNWFHLQDGSGSEGPNDLTVTTDATVNVGDLVLVTGKISVDRDFGFGYKYSVIIEDAKVTIE